MKKNQKIKCNVSNCKFNDTKTRMCDLDEIKVSCNCDACDCESKIETVCDDFEAKKK